MMKCQLQGEIATGVLKVKNNHPIKELNKTELKGRLLCKNHVCKQLTNKKQDIFQ